MNAGGRVTETRRMKSLEHKLETLMFNSRWLLAPFYLGLILAIAVLLVKFIKELNSQPPQRARYDRELVRGNRPDGGWIFSGGFNYG